LEHGRLHDVAPLFDLEVGIELAGEDRRPVLEDTEGRMAACLRRAQVVKLPLVAARRAYHDVDPDGRLAAQRDIDLAQPRKMVGVPTARANDLGNCAHVSLLSLKTT